ncbi:MAG: hypothetical protein Kow0069_36890 [Promethearchaeota archaeon]
MQVVKNRNKRLAILVVALGLTTAAFLCSSFPGTSGGVRASPAASAYSDFWQTGSTALAPRTSLKFDYTPTGDYPLPFTVVFDVNDSSAPVLFKVNSTGGGVELSRRAASYSADELVQVDDANGVYSFWFVNDDPGRWVQLDYAVDLGWPNDVPRYGPRGHSFVANLVNVSPGGHFAFPLEVEFSDSVSGRFDCVNEADGLQFFMVDRANYSIWHSSPGSEVRHNQLARKTYSDVPAYSIPTTDTWYAVFYNPDDDPVTFSAYVDIEGETQDEWNLATPMGSSASGTLQHQEPPFDLYDDKLFSFVQPAGKNVTVELAHSGEAYSGANLYDCFLWLYVYNSSHQLVGSDEATSNGTRKVEFQTGDAGGTYYVRVEGPHLVGGLNPSTWKSTFTVTVTTINSVPSGTQVDCPEPPEDIPGFPIAFLAAGFALAVTSLALAKARKIPA